MSIVYIGKKPIMNYVVATMTVLNSRENTGKVVLKARGQAITQLVNVVEILRNKFLRDIKIDDITIGTEELEGNDDQLRRVSVMEIILRR